MAMKKYFGENRSAYQFYYDWTQDVIFVSSVRVWKSSRNEMQEDFVYRNGQSRQILVKVFKGAIFIPCQRIVGCINKILSPHTRLELKDMGFVYFICNITLKQR